MITCFWFEFLWSLLSLFLELIWLIHHQMIYRWYHSIIDLNFVLLLKVFLLFKGILFSTITPCITFAFLIMSLHSLPSQESIESQITLSWFFYIHGNIQNKKWIIFRFLHVSFIWIVSIWANILLTSSNTQIIRNCM